MRAGAAHLRKEGDDEQRAGRMESVPEPDADSAELDAARRHAPDPDTAVELPTDAVVAPEPLALGPLAEVAAVADDGEPEAHMISGILLRACELQCPVRAEAIPAARHRPSRSADSPRG